MGNSCDNRFLSALAITRLQYSDQLSNPNVFITMQAANDYLSEIEKRDIQCIFRLFQPKRFLCSLFCKNDLRLLSDPMLASVFICIVMQHVYHIPFVIICVWQCY